MAKCDNCGVGVSSKIRTLYGGYCKLCAEIPNKDKSRFDSPSSSEPKDIYSLGNGLTVTGFIFILLSFMIGDFLSAINYEGTVFQQIALTLAFGFLGIALIMLGIAKTFLDVITANNEKDKS